METRRKRYTKEFKLEAVKLVTEQGYTQSEASESLGISYQNLSRWIGEVGAKNKEPKKLTKLSLEQEELVRLRKENKRLKMEREILKKAAAFFANEKD
jgi:transposase